MSLELFTIPASEPPLEWKIRLARAELDALIIEHTHSESLEDWQTEDFVRAAEEIDEAEHRLAILEAEQLRRLQSSTAAAGVFQVDDKLPKSSDATEPAAAASISTPARGASGSLTTGGSSVFPPLESAGVDSLSTPAPQSGEEPGPAIADAGVISNTKTP